MTQTLNQRLKEELAAILERHVEPIFKPGVRLTIIARTPDNDEADVLVTSDGLDDIAAVISRSQQREVVR